MIAASRIVKQDLDASVDLQAVVQGNCFWELAPDGQVLPCITYRIGEIPRRSKDGGGSYALAVRCFGDTLTKAAELAELAKTALKAAGYSYASGTSGYTDAEDQEGFVELNFNFNL